jgi:DNA-binding NarL/FixJ family response regulator
MHLDFAAQEMRAMKMQPLLAHALGLSSGEPPTRAARHEPTSLAGLTRRELEVFCLLAAGKTNREIADALVISPNTVVRHVSTIFNKTSVANRAEAAVWAVRRGLI